MAHLCDVRVHVWPIKAEADAMESAGGIEMATGGFAVEGNEHNIPKIMRHRDKTCVGFQTSNGFAIDKEPVCAVICIELGIIQAPIQNCAWILDKLNDGCDLGIVLIGN
jgi:hypothetical protein